MERGDEEKRRDGEEEEEDLYGVLGLNKECSLAELRSAYKKLALKWHPDRCSWSGNSKSVEDSKKKFQAIQQAYSVLSDTNKRFLYDVGVYDFDDEDDENGMGDFLDEMAAMMNNMKSSEGESFEELQVMFEEMFQSGGAAFFAETKSFPSSSSASSCSNITSSYSKNNSNHNVSNKRNSADFCMGTGGGGGWTRQEGREAARSGGRKKHGRK